MGVVLAVAGAMVGAILIGPAPDVFAWVMGAPLALMVLVGAGYLSRQRIMLTAGEIVLRGLLFKRREARARVVEAVRATIVAHRGSPGDTLFLLDAHRNVILRLNAGAYRREDIDRLVKALGVPCREPGRPVTGKELAREFPGLDLVSWVERHPVLLAFIICGVLFAVLMAGIVIGVAA
ncbi:hypothetical protein ACFQ07_21675 [Actinomadura adrarensis]|uniref:PH domain-containing protein n=1 Tax=Actinomadura adrarensis TaxID=1819600 RepID=A0ABW3CLS0_9ACTN